MASFDHLHLLPGRAEDDRGGRFPEDLSCFLATMAGLRRPRGDDVQASEPRLPLENCESTMAMTLLTIVAHGLAPAERQALLALLLLGLLWFGSVLAGVVYLVISAFKPDGWRLRIRRSLAVANLITTGAAIAAFVVIGELDSEPIFLSWVGVVMTCILGIPVIGHKSPFLKESTSDATEAQGKIPPS